MSNYCIICCRPGSAPMSPSSPKDNPCSKRDKTKEEELLRRYFHLMERYLNDGQQVEGEGRKLSPKFPLDEVLNMGMTSCPECLKVMSSFCKLYEELKRIELLLNWKVWMVKNLIESGQGVIPMTEQFRKGVRKLEVDGTCPKGGIVDTKDTIDYDYVLESRKSMIDECSRKLKNALPRLSLVKWQDDYGMTHPTGTTVEGKGNSMTSDDIEGILKGQNLDCDAVHYDNSLLGAQNENNLGAYESKCPETHARDFGENVVEEMEPTQEPSPCKLTPKMLSCLNLENVEKPLGTEASSYDGEIVTVPKHALSTTNPVHRVLRTVLRCSSCSRTFSSGGRLANHEVECGIAENADDNGCDVKSDGTGDDNDCCDTDTTDTSDDADYNDDDLPCTAGCESETLANRVIQNRVGEQIDRKNIKEESNSLIDDDEEDDGNEMGTTVDLEALEKVKVEPFDPNFSKRKPTGNGVKQNFLTYRYKCPDCSYFFLQLHSLLRHRKKTHHSKSNKSAKASLDSHPKISVNILSFEQRPLPALASIRKFNNFKILTRIQVLDNLHLCPVTTCQRPFYFMEDLDSHSKLHGQFKCQFCDVAHEYAPALSMHELTHHIKKGKKRIGASHGEMGTTTSWNCYRCKLPCLRQEKYLRHHLASHLNLPFVDKDKCGICGTLGESDNATFTNAKLAKHYKNFHGLDDNMEPKLDKACRVDNCNAYFVSQLQLSWHNNARHHGDSRARPKCQTCNKTYKNMNSLRQHRHTVHKAIINLIPCTYPNCSIAYETQEEIDNHIRNRHGSGGNNELLVCSKCKKCFFGNGQLRVHMKWHERTELIEAGLESIAKHVCESCGKCFRTKKNLQQHALVHSGPESWEFACAVCSKKCMTQNKLDEHMRTHTKEKMFVCQICGQKYAHRHNLRIHVNNKHGDVMDDKPRTFNKANLSSRKGIKRKRDEDEGADKAKLKMGASASDTD